tara:strand:+ start:668 stop:904 length:237 start_codon:yes stop_codon:yes gene_type:complete
MEICYSFSRLGPLNCIGNYPSHVVIVIDWISFMSWTKVEDLAFATIIATTAPKYLSTWKPTDSFALQVNIGRIIIYAA